MQYAWFLVITLLYLQVGPLIIFGCIFFEDQQVNTDYAFNIVCFQVAVLLVHAITTFHFVEKLEKVKEKSNVPSP